MSPSRNASKLKFIYFVKKTPFLMTHPTPPTCQQKGDVLKKQIISIFTPTYAV
jgi:hypothetical protein